MPPHVGKIPLVKASSNESSRQSAVLVQFPETLRATAFSAMGLPPGLALDPVTRYDLRDRPRRPANSVKLSASNNFGSTHRNWLLMVVGATEELSKTASANFPFANRGRTR